MDGPHEFDGMPEPRYFDFSKALLHLKSGEKIARDGWNGKDMWLCLVDGDSWGLGDKVPYDYEQIGHGLLPFIGMKTAQNQFIPWLASQADLLAEDWEIVK